MGKCPCPTFVFVPPLSYPTFVPILRLSLSYVCLSYVCPCPPFVQSYVRPSYVCPYPAFVPILCLSYPMFVPILRLSVLRLSVLRLSVLRLSRPRFVLVPFFLILTFPSRPVT